MTLTLLIGGTRSGKSARAEQIASTTGLPVCYLATADGSDPHMAQRIADHAARRPTEWETIEVGDDLARVLEDTQRKCVLLDGLGVWIAGVLHRAGVFDGIGDSAASARAGAGDAAGGARIAAQTEAARARIAAQIDRLLAACEGPEPVIVVAEQAGAGLLPADSASRLWLDLLGESVQRLSRAAERVELIVAGRALALHAGAASAASPGSEALDASVPVAPASVAHTPLVPDVDACPGGEQLRRHGDEDVRPGDTDHAVNVIAGGPPGWLRRALHEALEGQAGRYPDERAACAALASMHERAPDEVVPTNGAAEALWLLPAALCPRLAACVHPAFTEAEAALRAHRVPVVRVIREPGAGLALDPEAVPEGADLVIVGNPASPCGTLTPADTLLALRRPGRVLVVDEAFMSLVPGEPGSLAGERLDDVIVVRSLTKALSIPGLRAGYALAGAKLAGRLRGVRPPWSANALALAALRAAAARPDALAEIAQRAQDEREDLAERLHAIPGVRLWSGAANFCLIEVPDGPTVLGALRDRAIAVRPAASFPGLGASHLRITARDAAANARLATALQEAVTACV